MGRSPRPLLRHAPKLTQVSSALATLGGVALGGVLTAGATFAIESVKERRARAREGREFARKLETRWDDKLAQVAGEFVSTTRRCCTQLVGSTAVSQRWKRDSTWTNCMNDCALCSRNSGSLRIVPGNRPRDIIRLTYRVRELGERGAPKGEQDAAHDDVLNAIAA